jgi:hypothetical protein
MSWRLGRVPIGGAAKPALVAVGAVLVVGGLVLVRSIR